MRVPSGLGNGLGCRFVASQKTLPDFVDVTAERRDPAHAANAQAHAATVRMITEALVPPKPNELERTVRIGAVARFVRDDVEIERRDRLREN